MYMYLHFHIHVYIYMYIYICIYIHTYIYIGGGGVSGRSEVDRATSQLAGRLVNDKTDAHTRLIDLLTRTGILAILTDSCKEGVLVTQQQLQGWSLFFHG
jgi:hypothetical protein